MERWLVPPRKALSDPSVESESLCPDGILMSTLPINLSAIQRDRGAWGVLAAADSQPRLGAGSGEEGGPPPPDGTKSIVANGSR